MQVGYHPTTELWTFVVRYIIILLCLSTNQPTKNIDRAGWPQTRFMFLMIAGGRVMYGNLERGSFCGIGLAQEPIVSGPALF